MRRWTSAATNSNAVWKMDEVPKMLKENGVSFEGFEGRSRR